MNGQWIGSYSGTNTGRVVADLDDARTHYAGVVFAYDNDIGKPRTCAEVAIPKDQTSFSLQGIGLAHIDRGSGLVLTPENLAQKYPGVAIPTHADTEWEVMPNQISLKWKTNIGTNGEGWMVKSEGQNPSLLIPRSDVKTWEEFTKFALTLDPYHFAFRGHEKNTWRLRTAFHRTGRASLMKFSFQDVPALHRHLSGLTTHHFDFNDRLDYAAFLNLAQHHGYPTPILDWTQSPFLAAYFAFKDLRTKNPEPDQKVRILILDSWRWNINFERALVLMPGFLHMTMLEPLTIDNPRALPQQSISSVTNVDDLETYVAQIEKREGKSYLSAIDLPVAERQNVMQDLALMGITAGALFPGLDGACLQLKERFFDL
jgi:FRG domain